MVLARFVGSGSMAVARALRAATPGGVIICGHTLSAREMRSQVDVLGRWFDFIHHDDLLERMARPRSRPFCLLTFDDGKRSNATEVAPALERLGVPAVFYVVTEYLTTPAPLWFDWRDAIVGALGFTPPGLEVSTLKRLPLAAVEERLARASAEYGVGPDITSDDVGPMSWDDARQLARQGFSIGAHSRRHATLTAETEGDATSDIERSIATVTAELGTPCPTFAFPNGNYTQRLALHALHAGVSTVVTTDPMWADARFPRWRIPRVQLFGKQTSVEIELKLAAAATGRLLTNPNGTGRRYTRDTRASADDLPGAMAG